jgi:hypothetical protein
MRFRKGVDAHLKLATEHLSKQYPRGVWGLRDFSLELGPGVIGLLGRWVAKTMKSRNAGK